MISDVGSNLDAMNEVQYVLAFVFLASYALALGQFIGTRGRLIAVATTLSCAAGFAALTDPWEQGLMLVVVALAGMGVFVCCAWALWTVASWHDRQQERASQSPAAEPARTPGAPSSAAPSRRRLWGFRST